MYWPKKIIDSHVHLITAETHRIKTDIMSRLDQALVEAYHERWKTSLTSRKEEKPEPLPPDLPTVAGRWEKELDRVGIEKAVFLTSDEAHDELIRFISLKPDRFCGYTTFDPTKRSNADLLRRQVQENGIKGLKLYPMKRYFHVDDPACFSVYEVCQEKGIPILIHFGLSISATHDLQYGNPLELSGPALRFPAVKWIIPHFGTGFFRETLLLAAQYSNIYIDTSSSNGWIKYSPYPLTLADVFKRTYETVGSKRIFFGTDSSFFPRGYRSNLLEEQLRIWNELQLPDAEIDDILYCNIKDVLDSSGLEN
jgi:predicted TIM-barrel fold metal-dependent hydrolase